MHHKSGRREPGPSRLRAQLTKRVALAAGALVAAHAKPVFAQETVSPAHPPEVAAFDIVPTDASEGSDLVFAMRARSEAGEVRPSIRMQT